ncbi:MAG: 30S ribosomal protein S12 methylthiotransferase RimO, partial [Endomicrobia bacterium]|nr:30S ribosomal protein S12 methylthiotransferase RimO [Endomicrobiia bacterium]
FPTETEKDFNLLLKDIKQLEFDWLGCFIFSLQKGTKAAKLKPLVPKEVKKQRFDEIMKLQQKITFSKNQSRIGKTFELLIDENNVGHTGFQCPEVDGKTYITSVVDSTQLIVKIKVQDVVNIYDLSAQLC